MKMERTLTVPIYGMVAEKDDTKRKAWLKKMEALGGDGI